MNKRKIFNDPVYGFISIPYDIVFDVIEHPYFQRLRRIQQLGLSSLVYPGATHSRFHHSLGAMHLMYRSLEVLKSKGQEITEDESKAAVLAILMHDLGHGPFSHALEGVLVENLHHEHISMLLMRNLQKEFGKPIEMAIQIFTNQYPKRFLYQLVSGQLDMDRLDYLNRDSFYSGVSEGVVGYDRIINMLDVHDDNIVVEEKGIYSIEKFIVARRLMYWQVYLHKTSLVADLMLKNAVLRAKEVYKGNKKQLEISANLNFFLSNTLSLNDFDEHLTKFAALDDYDIFQALKVWMNSEDVILKTLSTSIINRKLFKIEF
ncbi:MAG TPA: HD domain-containing protein, partial [Chitinophagales bacterium]|nr:HD domain-containing protein [Chitinophagales bacterium]